MICIEESGMIFEFPEEQMFEKTELHKTAVDRIRSVKLIVHRRHTQYN